MIPAPGARRTSECGRRGLKAVIVITGGFKEAGPEGAALEERLETDCPTPAACA